MVQLRPEFALALLLLKLPGAKDAFLWLNGVLGGLEKATAAGTSLVFGYLGAELLLVHDRTVLAPKPDDRLDLRLADAGQQHLAMITGEVESSGQGGSCEGSDDALSIGIAPDRQPAAGFGSPVMLGYYRRLGLWVATASLP
mgnify:CR=1 FL=1